jgi:branched-chain amino acid aminotransferase
LNYIQANTGGRLHAATEPSIAPLDRGFLYGDSIYEVWRTYHGVVFAWDEHWRRLENSATALHMRLERGPAEVLAEIRRTVAEYRRKVQGNGELYVRLQISRGAGQIGLDIALADRSEYVILVQPCPEIPAALAKNGVHLSLSTALRRNPVQALDPAWKTGNYLNNLLCLREAKLRGADDVLILNLSGEIAEASVSNVAFVSKGRIVTPPLSAGILGGITRGVVLGGVAAAAGLEAIERTVLPAEIPSMEECFLMSTTKDIVPVGRIDDVPFPLREGSAASRLKGAFAGYAADYARAHPDLRL